jgi:hypothetical protein
MSKTVFKIGDKVRYRQATHEQVKTWPDRAFRVNEVAEVVSGPNYASFSLRWPDGLVTNNSVSWFELAEEAPKAPAEMTDEELGAEYRKTRQILAPFFEELHKRGFKISGPGTNVSITKTTVIPATTEVKEV